MPTSNLGIVELTPSQTNKEMTVNEALEHVDSAITETHTITVTGNASISADDLNENLRVLLSPGDPAPTGSFYLSVPDTAKRLFMVTNGTAVDAGIRRVSDSADAFTIEAGTSVIIYATGSALIQASALDTEDSIEVQNGGTVVAAEARTVNFGDNLTATVDASDPNKVNVAGEAGGTGTVTNAQIDARIQSEDNEATFTRRGTVELANADESRAGQITNKASTPRGLRRFLNAVIPIAQRLPAFVTGDARKIPAINDAGTGIEWVERDTGELAIGTIKGDLWLTSDALPTTSWPGSAAFLNTDFTASAVATALGVVPHASGLFANLAQQPPEGVYGLVVSVEVDGTETASAVLPYAAGISLNSNRDATLTNTVIQVRPQTRSSPPSRDAVNIEIGFYIWEPTGVYTIRIRGDSGTRPAAPNTVVKIYPAIARGARGPRGIQGEAATPDWTVLTQSAYNAATKVTGHFYFVSG